jgi:hypothetical protein
MTDNPTVPVELRDASVGLVYARAGEATYCASGHLVGHFRSDALTGSVPAGELVPVEGINLGDYNCPWCGSQLTGGQGLYYFAAGTKP